MVRSVRLHLLRELTQQLAKVNLSPVKRIKVIFDPFSPKVASARYFLFSMSAKKIRNTNVLCSLTGDVKSDRSEPLVECVFNDDHKAIFKTQNLSVKEIVEEFNNICQQKLDE